VREGKPKGRKIVGCSVCFCEQSVGHFICPMLKTMHTRNVAFTRRVQSLDRVGRC
jgi:hypothetical protein